MDDRLIDRPAARDHRGFSGNPGGCYDRRQWAWIDLQPEAAASRMLLTLGVAVGGLALLNWLLVRRRGRGIPLLLGLVLVGGISFLIWRAWALAPRRWWWGRASASYRDLGLEEAGLGVNTQSLNGTFRLYEGLGFEKVKRWTDYRKPLEE